MSIACSCSELVVVLAVVEVSGAGSGLLESNHCGLNVQELGFKVWESPNGISICLALVFFFEWPDIEANNLHVGSELTWLQLIWFAMVHGPRHLSRCRIQRMACWDIHLCVLHMWEGLRVIVLPRNEPHPFQGELVLDEEVGDVKVHKVVNVDLFLVEEDGECIGHFVQGVSTMSLDVFHGNLFRGVDCLQGLS